MNNQYLKGKCAIVTGASRGIGRAIAAALARQSASTFTGKAVMVPAYGRKTIFIYGRGLGERPWVRID